MAATITETVNDITDPVNVILQADFLERARQVAIYTQGTKPGRQPLHAGSNTAKWRRYNNISPSTTALSEQTTVISFTARDSVVPTITDVTATVARYGQHFLVNEEVDLVNPTSQEAELLDIMAIAAGRSINRLVRDEMEDNSTQIRAGGAGSDGAIVSKFTRDSARHVQKVLQQQSAMRFFPMTMGSQNYATSPTRAAFIGFCSVDVEPDVRDHAGFLDVEKYAGQISTYMNEIGSSQGIRFLSTEEASSTANGGGSVGETDLISTGGTLIDLYDTIIMGMNAVGTLSWDMPAHPEMVYRAGDQIPSVQIINKPRGTSGIADPYNEIGVLGYKFWEVEKILNANWIRRVTSGASNLNN